ncbi:MAG: hypothetical protein HYT07_03525 [Candidatus Levybacteria bacterium]|nr:hypothetical protein [Candidatus Levybacteria bacterium]
MDPQIRNFAQIERFIRERPKEADAKTFEWQNFSRKYPEALGIGTPEEFYRWARQKNIDPDIWIGKEIADTYYYLRSQHEDIQMQKNGSVDLSNVPQSLAGVPVLAAMFLERPKIIQDDKDYKKIEEKLKKDWLEKNPGKDFSSQEGLDYLYGSLENEDLPSLSKDAQKTYRDNPKYAKRLERYDREKKKIYKNPENDPAIIRLNKTIEEHVVARSDFLKKGGGNYSMEEVGNAIKKHEWSKFAKDHPEKTNSHNLLSHEKNSGEQIKPEEREDKPSSQNISRILRKIQQEESRPANLTRIPSQSTRAGRFLGRTFGRGGGGAGRGIARIGGRLAVQAGMAAGRAVATGVGALVSNPVGWIVIGVIILIIIIVFLIIFLAGRDGGQGHQLFGVDCSDPNGNNIMVADGNACARNLAEYHSREEGITITASCVDKCTNGIIACDKNPSYNSCFDDPNVCIIEHGFCIEYSPADASKKRVYDCAIPQYYFKSGLFIRSCSAPTPTPTLIPSQPTP